MAAAAQGGFPLILAMMSRLVLCLALQGLVSRADGAALRGSMRGSILMQVEATTGGKVAALEAEAELPDVFAEERAVLMNDIADDPASGLLDPTEDSGGHHHQAAQLRRVARIVDTDNDARISEEELRSFAHGLKERQRRDHTLTAMRLVDADGSGDVDLAELQAVQRNASSELLAQQAQRFSAADSDENSRLDFAEFHAFVHPELDDRVLAVEVARQLSAFDADGDGLVDFREFEREGAAHSKDFSQEAALEDFELHDSDADGRLSAHEFGRLLSGHDLLQDSIRKALEAGDGDGDGHIHVDDELPGRLQHLLESEFIEDYFFHKHAESPGRHSEL